MDLGSIGNLLKSYIGGSAPTDETAHEHSDNVAQGVNSSTLAQGIAAAFRSDQTPPFAQMVSQLFTNGSVDQKTGMLNALLGSASPAMLSQLAGLLPGRSRFDHPESGVRDFTRSGAANRRKSREA